MIYVTHVRLSPPDSRNHQHIVKLAWRDPSSGETGQSSREQLVTWIERGGDARVQGPPDVRVHVVDARPRYLRTAANNTYTDNLLYLPRF
ncbi:DUF3892 domain-containing protein [Aeromicrobium terrae]|uniref:DUF3892 domain-containing protein n=1 Tax=Aeromicrobium terrae TaxID=2498846 RepID=A0A5C8NMH6_9ACTN|nr:DUF3892 domain-containing protein [Aeromicrobium terrae]TXL62356.1 DUF3892 domain-containing protein [Aeromicrobium terrae]